MRLLLPFLISGMFLTMSAQDSLNTSQDQMKKPVFTVQIAKVIIISEPEGAEVYIADEEIGITPVEFEYPAGRHKVSLSIKGFPEIEETLVVKAPETRKKYVFADVRATLTINTFKKVKVFINGEFTKEYERIKLQPGEYRLKVEMDSTKTLEKTVSLSDKEDKTIMMYPDYPVGSVQITTSPDSCFTELWEEGFNKYSCYGNRTFSNLPAGVYKLKIKKKGHKSYSEEFIIEQGTAVKRNVKLKPGPDIGGEYVLVEGGSFEMGGSQGCTDELPIHKVSVSSFYISKYETTQAEWNYIMGKSVSEFTGDSLPVENVSWYDAVKFCNKMSETEGLQKCYTGTGSDIVCDFKANGYRLPTEAEWEYASGGGKKSHKYLYSGSDRIQEVAVYTKTAKESTCSVGSRMKANELGLYDMTGNVSEWCWDWYDVYPDDIKNLSNPTGPVKGFLRVIRGGSWFNYEKCARVCCRNLYNPNDKYFYIGFRMVRSIK